MVVELIRISLEVRISMVVEGEITMEEEEEEVAGMKGIDHLRGIIEEDEEAEDGLVESPEGLDDIRLIWRLKIG